MAQPSLFVPAGRVALVRIPTAAIEYRLRSRGDEFTVPTTIDAEGGCAPVRYPATWPGEAIGFFTKLLAQRQAGDVAGEALIGSIVERSLLVAVGGMGTHGPPVDGAVEIGYGIEPAFRDCGYATEMVRSFSSWLLARTGVTVVTAECLVSNAASIRVLEKGGFARCGERTDSDGPVLLWKRRAATICGA